MLHSQRFSRLINVFIYSKNTTWKRYFSIQKDCYAERKEMAVRSRLAYLDSSGPVVHPSVLKEKYRNLLNGQKCPSEEWLLGGRVLGMRELGTRLCFMDLYHDGVKMQIIIDKNSDCEGGEIPLRGDIIEVFGRMERTRGGELSLRASRLRTLTPCLLNLPDIHAPELTCEHKARYRHLDLISKPDGMEMFKKKSLIFKLARQFLDQKGFMEVETPILVDKPGGANARPFDTMLHGGAHRLSLRIATELYLKRLIISGFDRVFEMGKIFRNEGMDSSHVPEFTSIELYQSFASCSEMIQLAKEFLLHLSKSVNQADFIEYQGQQIDLSVASYETIDVVDYLQEKKVLKESLILNDPKEASKQLKSVLMEYQSEMHWDQNNNAPSYLFDKLVSHFIEPLTQQQPTFLINHPTFSSPLAKESSKQSGKSLRFELFIAGKELMNGYSELANPNQQRKRFRMQLEERNQGNEEASLPDEDYCGALEAGMPPTGGLGIGMDRLVMLLCNKKHIRDVLFFPLMKPKHAT